MIATILAASLSYLPADPRDLMREVEDALVGAGFAASGYAVEPVPPVTFHDALPGNRWGEYVGGEIRISRDQPIGCVRVTLAHEFAHDAAVRMRLVGAGPVWAVKADLERIAAKVEHAVMRGEWLPNCLMRGRVE